MLIMLNIKYSTYLCSEKNGISGGFSLHNLASSMATSLNNVVAFYNKCTCMTMIEEYSCKNKQVNIEAYMAKTVSGVA